jgi:hypothetical protein
MTREDIIRLAREAGGSDTDPSNLLTIRQLIHFAALVAEAEREAICQIVYGLCVSDNNAQEIVNAIRARGRE